MLETWFSTSIFISKLTATLLAIELKKYVTFLIGKIQDCAFLVLPSNLTNTLFYIIKTKYGNTKRLLVLFGWLVF